MLRSEYFQVHSADKILELLNLGNNRRKTESTESNSTSSRSHAVLEITVKRKHRNNYQNHVLQGKLALVDLAGSERASETNSGDQKLSDGANINRSLLALASCINALGKHQKKGLAYVPYRNSKLTRILKDGLSGNSQTVMVATISPMDSQYHHTVNTLKYADRAKEIKTHIQKNIGTIDTHVSDYQMMIDSLQVEVCQLKKELAEKESKLNNKYAEKAVDDEVSWLNILSKETSENVRERINLQKALFEVEEINLCNRTELQHLDDAITNQQSIERDGPVLEALRARRQAILDNIRDNDEAGVNYQKEVKANEKNLCELQDKIEKAISSNENRTYLHILSQYRLLGMANMELQFEVAMRDQVINNQREAVRNLWDLLMGLGLGERRILDLAAKQGIMIEDWARTPHSCLSARKQQSNLTYGKCNPFGFCSVMQRWNSADAFHKENHPSSFYLFHDHSPSALMRRMNYFENNLYGKPGSGTPEKQLYGPCPHIRTQASPCESFMPKHQKDSSYDSFRHVYGGAYATAGCSSQTRFMNYGETARRLFGYSPLEQGFSMPNSSKIFPHTQCPNRPALAHMPSFST